MGTQPALNPRDLTVESAAFPLNVSLRALEPVRKVTRGDLPGLFDAVFSERPALQEEEIQHAYRLRYQVYCLDKGYEDPKARPEGFECDEYDERARHSLLVDRQSGDALGTVRLVHAFEGPDWLAGLPLAAYAEPASLAALAHLPGGSTAEVSRFSVSRRAAGRLRSASVFQNALKDNELARPAWQAKLLPYMSLGLVRGLVRMSVEAGITHWCLAAEPSLLRRLRAFGLYFVDCGPLVEHRGLRQVCYAKLDGLLERAARERPEMWDIMTQGGSLWPQETH